MAKSELNRALTEMRGTIDGFTYRTTAEGKLSVYASNPPKVGPSAKQVSGRERFALAQQYAKRVLADPLQRIVYQRLGKARKRPANTLLAANYLNPPEIEVLATESYTGQAGQEIRVVAFDDIAVAVVTVVILGSDGIEIERGAAVEQHGVWTLRSSVNAPASAGWSIAATATNRAGHAITATVTLVRKPDGTVAALGTPVFQATPPPAQ